MANTKIPVELSSTPGIVDNSNATAITIDSSENVGIGTASPSVPLNVVSAYSSGAVTTSLKLATVGGYDSGSGTALEFGQDQGTYPTWVSGKISSPRTDTNYGGSLVFSTNRNSSATDVSEAMRIDSSGVVHINGSTSYGNSNHLTIATGGANVQAITTNSTTSSSHYIGRFYSGGTEIGSIYYNSSAVAYNTSSDARLKNVTGEARGLEVINELNPVAYNWKESGQADEGLIAQEVKEIVPNAVSGSEEEMYQMDYSKLVVHLVKGMKEQQTQIEALQSEINLLKGE